MTNRTEDILHNKSPPETAVSGGDGHLRQNVSAKLRGTSNGNGTHIFSIVSIFGSRYRMKTFESALETWWYELSDPEKIFSVFTPFCNLKRYFWPLWNPKYDKICQNQPFSPKTFILLAQHREKYRFRLQKGVKTENIFSGSDTFSLRRRKYRFRLLKRL